MSKDWVTPPALHSRQAGLTPLFLCCSKQIMDPQVPHALRLQAILVGELCGKALPPSSCVALLLASTPHMLDRVLRRWLRFLALVQAGW